MLPFGTELLAGNVTDLLSVAKCRSPVLTFVRRGVGALRVIQFALAVVTAVAAGPAAAPVVVYVHVASAKDLQWLAAFAYPCRELAMIGLCALDS